MNSCTFYDVFDECYARFDAMIGTMNEKHECFIGRMREYDLLHEIDPSLPCPKLEARLYDDCECSLTQESNIVDDAPLTDLGDVFDPPLPPLTLVILSFSSTHMDTSVSDSILLASPLPLA